MSKTTTNLRKLKWPFPSEDLYVNPIGNSVAKDYTKDFYDSNLAEVPYLAPDMKVPEADPSGGSLNEPGKKADAGKLLPWLFFSGFANALEKVAEVTTLGAKKYTPGGWATVPNGPERYMEAGMRHLTWLGQGEKFDSGPGGIGTLHKAQIIWNFLASLELELREEKKV